MKKLLGVLTVVMSATACSGQMDPPSIEQIKQGGAWFQMPSHDGELIWCWQYGARGKGMYGESPSWFTVVCDFPPQTTIGS